MMRSYRRIIGGQPTTCTICIDPGLGKGSGGTGWAVFAGSIGSSSKPVAPVGSGVVHPSREKSWVERAHVLAEAFAKAMSAWSGVRSVRIEFPDVWAGSARSHSAAVRGDLHKLCYLAALLASEMRRRGATHIQLISPREWKGQMSDVIVKRRVYRALKVKYRTHEADAVGIGLHLQGQL